MWNVRSVRFSVTTVHVLRLWKPDLSSSTPWHKSKAYSSVHLLFKESCCTDISILTHTIITSYCNHLVSNESAILWYCKLEGLIIRNDGKCCTPLFPVTSSPRVPSSFVSSSPPLLESPLNAELKKKEPGHPKKKGLLWF